MEFNFSEHIQQLAVGAVAGIGGAILGFKRLQKFYARDELDTTRANTETNVINMVYERLKELENVNAALVLQLESLRQENFEAKLQNQEMRQEISKLRQYIEGQFSPTYS